MIGTELKNDGQFEKALKFYRKELFSAKSATSKVVAYRDLGQVYGIKDTRIFNPDSSAFYRKLSLFFIKFTIYAFKYSVIKEVIIVDIKILLVAVIINSNFSFSIPIKRIMLDIKIKIRQ